LSSSYISLLMAEEGLPHFKIGRAVRFRVREVAAWLQKRSQP
jgi:predicted DNA-binding transcriptional regulator AlpA